MEGRTVIAVFGEYFASEDCPSAYQRAKTFQGSCKGPWPEMSELTLNPFFGKNYI